MLSGVEYRHLRLDERSLIQDLFESYYDGSVYCTESSYFDWLHLDHPQHSDCANDDEFTVLAAINDGQLLGCVSYVPSRVHADGRQHSAVITTESLARPDATGVYGLLARRLTGRFDMAYVMGATEFLQDLYVKQLGAHYRHEIPRLVLVGDDGSLRQLLEHRPDATPIDNSQLRVWAEATQQLAEGHQWSSIESAADLQDHYWQGMLHSGIPCLRRDPEWLAWRYFRHPHLRYDVISVEPSQTSGIAVIRRESPDGLDGQVLRLLEFLPTPGARDALAGAVAKFVLDTQSAFLDVFCAHDESLAALPAAFVRFADHLPHAIPYLLQPPEWRPRRSINLLSIRNRRRRHVPLDFCDGQIYLTKGDGAQDILLNQSYHSAHLR